MRVFSEACSKFASLNERRPELTHPWKSEPDDRAVRSSYGSDMSIDDDDAPLSPPPRRVPAASQPPPDPSRESSIEREPGNKPANAKDETSTPNQPESIQASQPSRRLSVQDKINMFENKQKENSGGKPAVVKPVELRRLSSDVSSTGAVLRRWSGASDMSIDLSGEKKDGDSPVCNPAASAAAVLDVKVLNLNDDNAQASSVAKAETKVVPSLSRGGDGGLKGVSFASSEQLFESRMNNSKLGSGESDVLKDQERGKTRSRSFVSRSEDQESSEDEFRPSVTGRNESMIGFGKSRGEEFSGSKIQMTGFKDQVSSSTHIRRLQTSKSGEQFQVLNQRESSESRDDESVKEVGVKAAQKTWVHDGGAGSKIRQAFASRLKGVEGDSSSAQQEVRQVRETEVGEKKEPRILEKASRASVASVGVTPTGKTEVVGKKESEKVSDTHVLNQEDSGPQRPKFSRQASTAELSKKARDGNSRAQFSGQVTVEAQEGSDSFSTPTGQSQRVRQSKGNQELDELKMKASEPEKMFAEHKLRVPGDQPNSARKGRLGDVPREPSSSLQYTKPITDGTSPLPDKYQSTQPSRVSKNSTKFDTSSPMKAADSQCDSDAMNKKFSDLSVSESSRGKFYDRYMQKRDAKLRDDWSANREEKEARLKSMQDSIERNRSDMKAKIFGSADTQDSVSSARQRAERLRSYSSRSIMKRGQVDS